MEIPFKIIHFGILPHSEQNLTLQLTTKLKTETHHCNFCIYEQCIQQLCH